MARAKSVLLAGLLLSCLAATVFARPAVPEADAGDRKALHDCPDTPKMKGCAPTGCALHTHGRASSLVCAKCEDDKAYLLVNAGTRKAQCECAPGYGGKGQEGVCKKCPPGTDIASGGPILRSVCLKCPKGSSVSADGLDCACPAGTYRAVADQPAGFKRIVCKPCAARAAYMEEDSHTRESCSTCKVPEVANKDHTKCVSPEDPEAAPAGDGVIGAITKRAANTPLGSLAQAFEEGRHETQEQRLMRKEGIPVPPKASSSSGTPAATASPLKALADRLRSALGEHKQADKLESALQETEEPQAKPRAQTERDSEDEDYKGKRDHKESRHSKDDDYFTKRERKHHNSHHEDKEDSEYYQDKRATKAQLKPEAKEQQKQEAKAEEHQKDAKPEQQQQQPAMKAPVIERPKEVGKSGDSSLASKLIPGLPVEAPTPTPAGPPSLADMAKKIGASLGRAAPRNPLPSTYIDPQALADAGLPPVKDVGQLMKSIMRSQIGDMDLSEWSHGVRGTRN